MEYITVREAAEKWSITERWVQKLCVEDRIKGAVRFSRVWMIPNEAEKPINGRKNFSVEDKLKCNAKKNEDE